MKTIYNVYRVLAFVVGVLLIVLVFIAVPMKYLLFAEGSEPQRFGDHLTLVLGVTHGWLYIAYLITAFLLAARARWSLPFTVLTLAAGTIPVLIFWVERQVSMRIHEEHPEIFATG